MEKSEKLREIAEVIAALGFKSSFSELVNNLEKELSALHELPLPVVYKIPKNQAGFLLSVSPVFCPSLVCSAICVGEYCLDSAVDWSKPLDKQLAERRKADGLEWQLPPLAVLSLLQEQVSSVDGVLKAFGQRPLFKGWYRSCEQDENGHSKVFNIVTGEISIEPEIGRYDICSRLCYLMPKNLKPENY